MKKIIFVVMMVVFASQANAQNRYLTLAQCQNDPFLYIEANYVHNTPRLIGKTVLEFANELELSVEPSQVGVKTYTSWDGIHPEWNWHYDGFDLDFYYEDLRYTISINLNPPYLYSEFNRPEIVQDDDTTWSLLYNSTNGIFKENTIKSIYVFKKKNGVIATKTYDRARDKFGLTGQALQDFLNQ